MGQIGRGAVCRFFRDGATRLTVNRAGFIGPPIRQGRIKRGGDVLAARGFSRSPTAVDSFLQGSGREACRRTGGSNAGLPASLMGRTPPGWGRYHPGGALHL